MNLKLKMISGAAMLVAAAAAQAGPFFLDVGANYSVPATAANGKVNDNSTSVKNEFLFKYNSKTVVTDVDASGGLSAGDTITTDGGLGISATFPVASSKDLTGNFVSGFDPNQGPFGVANNNGYGDDWFLSFRIRGLNGSITNVLGGVPYLAYGAGTVEMLFSKDGISFLNFMDVAVSGGYTTGSGLLLNGKADFANVGGYTDVDGNAVADAGWGDLKNMFNAADGKTCGGSTGFYDFWMNCGATEISFASHFDTNVLVNDFEVDPVTGKPTLASGHRGGATFTVPEPTTLALAGLALIGVASTRRRKA